MKKYGSPGPDGYDAVLPTILERDWFRDDGYGKPSFGQWGHVCLHATSLHDPHPQEGYTKNPESAADFRSITLLNVSFKVISKVLVNRLRPIMLKLIGPHQNSFLPGRSTMDNVILTQEVVHVMNNKRRKKNTMIIKIDLQKAYDSVSWDFLESTLQEFGFSRQLIDLILVSLRESSISIL